MPGDREISFAAVFKKHLRDVYGYVAFRLAPQMEDVQDITQEVFVAAFKAWDGFCGETTPLQWLRVIARRKLADYFKQRQGHVSIENMPSPVQVRIDGAALERAEALSAALRSLPQECATLLEEKYLDGCSVREMAQRHGKSEKAIESALARARALVRQNLSNPRKTRDTCHES